MGSSVRCARCGFIGFATSAQCKQCGYGHAAPAAQDFNATPRQDPHHRHGLAGGVKQRKGLAVAPLVLAGFFTLGALNGGAFVTRRD